MSGCDGEKGCACWDCRPPTETPPAEGDPLAEMRAYVARCERALGYARQDGATDSAIDRRDGWVEAAQAMLAIAERTVLPALSLAESERKAATMLADTYQRRAEAAEAAITELVAADATTDAQRMQRAWSKARRLTPATK